MTPDQKRKELENKLAIHAKQFLELRYGLDTHSIPAKNIAVSENRILFLKKVIQNVLFDMFVIDLNEKIEKLKAGKEDQCQPSTANSQPQVVSDGGTAQDL